MAPRHSARGHTLPARRDAVQQTGGFRLSAAAAKSASFIFMKVVGDVFERISRLAAPFHPPRMGSFTYYVTALRRNQPQRGGRDMVTALVIKVSKGSGWPGMPRVNGGSNYDSFKVRLCTIEA